MRIFLICLILLGGSYMTAFGQVQIGVFGGIANYEGDLVDRAYQSSKGAFELSLGYQISNRFALRGGLAFAKVAGADSLSRHPELRMRNLSFQSPITETSLVGELAVFDLDQQRWTPYFFGGIALFVFDPYTFDRQGRKVFLQAYSTEGEGIAGYPRPYSRLQWAIPFGGGFKFLVGQHVTLGMEIGLRKTSTDYLDDVSSGYADKQTLLSFRGPEAVALAYRGDELPGGNPNYPAKGYPRGSSRYKDYYYFTGLRLTYLFGERGQSGFSGSSRGRHGGLGCPSTPL